MLSEVTVSKMDGKKNNNYNKQQTMTENLTSSFSDKIYLERNIWFVRDSKTRSCQCRDDVSGVVHFETATEELSVLDCHCLTLDYLL